MNISSVILGFVAGIASKIIGDLLIREVSRPELRLDFHANSANCVTRTENRDRDGQFVSNCHYFSIRVSNIGRTTARNCRGYLVGIERLGDNGDWYTVAEDVIQLKWAYSDRSEDGKGYDLLPDMHRYLNIASVDERCPEKFTPSTISEPHSWRSHLMRTGKTRLLIQVAAEEAESRRRVIEIEWGAHWDEYAIARADFDQYES